MECASRFELALDVAKDEIGPLRHDIDIITVLWRCGPVQWSFLLAKRTTEFRRKLIGFDEETWHALNLLSRESMKSFQDLADEAFRDLLHKYRRPIDLKAALRESARPSAVAGSLRKRHPKAHR